MVDECCTPPIAKSSDANYRRILWWVFAFNGSMFGVEIIAGLWADSLSLQADALDFFSDSANYLIALFVLSRSIRWRAGAAMFKAVAMSGFGFFILYRAVLAFSEPGLPSAPVMGAVGLLALLVNLLSAWLLFHYRGGDSNRRSVWLCSRNDAIANCAVIAAGGAVAFLGQRWPDLLVGFLIATLCLWSSAQILRQALREWRE